jgi:hypothetical protein
MFGQGLDYRHTLQGAPCDAAQRILPIGKKPERVRFPYARQQTERLLSIYYS